MIAVPVVAGVLLLAYGLVHMLYLAPDMREFSTARSRPASGPMPPSGALALMAATVAAFLVAALAVWGVPGLSGAWPALTVVACVLSVALLVAPSRHTQGRESRTACPGPGRWRLPSGRAVCPGVQDFAPCPRRGDRAKCGSMGVTAGPERLHVADARAVLLIYGLSCVALGSEPVGHRSDEPPAQRRLGAGLRQRIRRAGVMMAAVALWVMPPACSVASGYWSRLRRRQ